MAQSIEVFRDLNLRGSLARRPDLRQALIAAAKDPWYYDPDRAAAIGRNAIEAEALAFGHKCNRRSPGCRSHALGSRRRLLCVEHRPDRIR